MVAAGRSRSFWIVGATMTLGHHLWLSSLQIAAERKRAAERARQRTVELGSGAEQFAELLMEEMHASMVSISGAAHAIDALYGEIRPLVPVAPALAAQWKANGTSRPDRIFETLKLGCRLGPRTNRWPRRFEALYELRDPVVHHEIRHQPVAPHPNGLANVVQEMADYCLENARESLDLAVDVAVTTMRQPKTPLLVAWAENMAHVPAAVEGFRSRSS